MIAAGENMSATARGKLGGGDNPEAINNSTADEEIGADSGGETR